MSSDSQYKNDIFVPTVAEFPNDIKTSWELQKPLADAGYRPGFMLFVRGADEGKPRVTDRENVKKQYDNLAKFSQQYKDAPIITMLPNIPIADIDFLNNSDFARDHVAGGIGFASNLPIGERKILTFHLNPLVTPERFRSQGQEEWYSQFNETIKPRLEEIAMYASGVPGGVDVMVETLCVPEFGDESEEDQNFYGETKRRHLRNPFYQFVGNKADLGIRDAGLGMCLDLCHHRTINHAIEDENEDLVYKEDITAVRQADRNLLNDAYSLNPETDVVHLNDGSGRYTSDGGSFVEGVALGDGDIQGLRKIITRLNATKTPIVLEINETDFDNRPNTKTSIDFLLSLNK